MNASPPGWASRLLRWFCKPYYVEIIEGDLFEIFERQVHDSPGIARRAFAWNVIRFFRWRYLKDVEDFHPKSSFGMYKNYFKISLRNLLKHRLYTGINIIGLVVAIASCLLIMIHVNNELSYDKFYKDHERVFYITNGNTGRNTPSRLVSTLKNDYPEVESGTRVWKIEELVGKINEKTFKFFNGLQVDSTFFNVFPQKFIAGNPANALTSPNSLVITNSFAVKYFNTANPIGEVISLEGEKYTITSIVADPPKNTHIPFEYITDLPRHEWVTQGYWTGNNFYSYLKLKPNVTAESFEQKFPEFVKRYFANELASFGENIDDYIDNRLEITKGRIYGLVPIARIHLEYPNLSLGTSGKLSNVYVLILIGALILLIAAVNYINMTTARAGLRHIEVGMRKTLGATSRELAIQFMVEAFLISFISVIIGIICCIIFLPFFNEIVERSLGISDLFSQESLFIVGMMMVLTAFLSGFYPAIYISKFKPIDALKGDTGVGKSFNTRKLLVVFQYAVSIFLIAITFIIYSQVRLMQSVDLGINTDQTFVVKNINAIAGNYEVFRNTLEALPEISAVSLSNTMPSQSSMANWNYRTVEDNPRQFSPDHIFSDDKYQEVLDIEFVSGRFFNRSFATDTMAVVINESFAKEIGGDVLNSQLTRGEGSRFNIIGVVKDFHPTSVKNEIRPLLFRYNEKAQSSLIIVDYSIVKIKGDYLNVVASIENAWRTVAMDYPFEGVFLNDSFQNSYREEERFGKMFTTFSILAIFIASLGLLSLAAYVIEKRFKEIAIRKVLGATTRGITYLINRDFVILVLIGASLALPLVYYYADSWLSAFPTRITFSWYLLAIPVIIVLVFSVLMVSIQSLRVATDNPVNALKQE